MATLTGKQIRSTSAFNASYSSNATGITTNGWTGGGTTWVNWGATTDYCNSGSANYNLRRTVFKVTLTPSAGKKITGFTVNPTVKSQAGSGTLYVVTSLSDADPTTHSYPDYIRPAYYMQTTTCTFTATGSTTHKNYKFSFNNLNVTSAKDFYIWVYSVLGESPASGAATGTNTTNSNLAIYLDWAANTTFTEVDLLNDVEITGIKLSTGTQFYTEGNIGRAENGRDYPVNTKLVVSVGSPVDTLGSEGSWPSSWSNAPAASQSAIYYPIANNSTATATDIRNNLCYANPRSRIALKTKVFGSVSKPVNKLNLGFYSTTFGNNYTVNFVVGAYTNDITSLYNPSRQTVDATTQLPTGLSDGYIGYGLTEYTQTSTEGGWNKNNKINVTVNLTTPITSEQTIYLWLVSFNINGPLSSHGSSIIHFGNGESFFTPNIQCDVKFNILRPSLNRDDYANPSNMWSTFDPMTFIVDATGTLTAYDGITGTLISNVFRGNCYKPGYTFYRWYENTSFTGGAYTKNSGVTAGWVTERKGQSITLYAKWNDNNDTYTIAYNLDGGTLSPAPGSGAINKDYGGSSTDTRPVNPTSAKVDCVELGWGSQFIVKNPTKAGHIFKGWSFSNFSSSTSSGTFKDAIGYVGSSNKYLREVANGTYAGQMMHDISNKNGDTVTLTAVWESLLTFDNKTLDGIVTSSSAQTKTITAASGGTGPYTYSLATISGFSLSGTTLTIAANQPGGTYTLSITATDTATGATKTATYTVIINYKIAYNANGGTGSAPTTPVSKRPGSSITVPANTFTKANTTANTTITVSYNANGGSSTPASGTGNAVDTTSYTFKEWALNSATGTKYDVGATYTTDANATFYAIWDSSTTHTSDPSITTAAGISKANGSATGYSVTYNANNGSGAPATQTSGNRTITYTFTKWTTAADGSGTAYNKSTAYTFTANTTLYAQFSSTTSNNSSWTCSSTEPTRTGYNFLGWSTSPTATTATYAAGDTKVITSNLTLYAVWSAASLVFSNQTITKNYSTSSQTFTITPPTSGTGSYTYSTTTSGFTINNNIVTIEARKAVGTHLVAITATDSGSGATATATYTVKINALTPSIEVTIPANYALYDGIHNLSLATISGNNCTPYLGISDSSTIAPTSWLAANAAVSVSQPGTYYIWAKATGNTGYSNINQTYKGVVVVKTPPVYIFINGNITQI